MSDTLTLRKELKERFLCEFGPAEKLFFLKKAREATTQKGYPACEDLFHYCYFLTLKERLCSISPQGGEGYMRFMLVESRREIEHEVKEYEQRLESKKLPIADVMGYKLLESCLV
jgi:hypothetical protein